MSYVHAVCRHDQRLGCGTGRCL